jgi:hypothetical protein
MSSGSDRQLGCDFGPHYSFPSTSLPEPEQKCMWDIPYHVRRRLNRIYKSNGQHERALSTHHRSSSTAILYFSSPTMRCLTLLTATLTAATAHALPNPAPAEQGAADVITMTAFVDAFWKGTSIGMSITTQTQCCSSTPLTYHTNPILTTPTTLSMQSTGPTASALLWYPRDIAAGSGGEESLRVWWMLLMCVGSSNHCDGDSGPDIYAPGAQELGKMNDKATSFKCYKN